MNLNREQLEELQWLSKHALKPHVRLKALTLLNWARGLASEPVVGILGCFQDVDLPMAPAVPGPRGPRLGSARGTRAQSRRQSPANRRRRVSIAARFRSGPDALDAPRIGPSRSLAQGIQSLRCAEGPGAPGIAPQARPTLATQSRPTIRAKKRALDQALEEVRAAGERQVML